jgi:hypothetical protein
VVEWEKGPAADDLGKVMLLWEADDGSPLFQESGQLVEAVSRRVRNVLRTVAGREEGRLEPQARSAPDNIVVERRLICKGIHHGVLRALQQAIESKVKRPAVAPRRIRAFVSKACDGGLFVLLSLL